MRSLKMRNNFKEKHRITKLLYYAIISFKKQVKFGKLEMKDFEKNRNNEINDAGLG